jgi:hypothetical protein
MKEQEWATTGGACASGRWSTPTTTSASGPPRSCGADEEGLDLGGVFVANERLCCTFSSENARCCSRSLTEKTNPGSEGKDWSGVRGSLGSWPTWGRRSPEWIRKSQNTQSPRLRFRALLTEGGDLSVQLHRTSYSPVKRPQESNFRFTEFYEIRMYRVLETSLPGVRRSPIWGTRQVG